VLRETLRVAACLKRESEVLDHGHWLGGMEVVLEYLDLSVLYSKARLDFGDGLFILDLRGSKTLLALSFAGFIGSDGGVVGSLIRLALREIFLTDARQPSTQPSWLE
jgi:hypothetical protein